MKDIELVPIKKEKEFEPFRISFTIETADEARMLWHITRSFNPVGQMLNGGYNASLLERVAPPTVRTQFNPLAFSVVFNELKRQGLYNEQE